MVDGSLVLGTTSFKVHVRDFRNIRITVGMREKHSDSVPNIEASKCRIGHCLLNNEEYQVSSLSTYEDERSAHDPDADKPPALPPIPSQHLQHLDFSSLTRDEANLARQYYDIPH